MSGHKKHHGHCSLTAACRRSSGDMARCGPTTQGENLATRTRCQAPTTVSVGNSAWSRARRDHAAVRRRADAPPTRRAAARCSCRDDIVGGLAYRVRHGHLGRHAPTRAATPADGGAVIARRAARLAGQGQVVRLGAAAAAGGPPSARRRRSPRTDLADDADVYFTTPHFDGYPAILVRLDRIALPELEELLVEAWLSRAPKRLATEYLDASP